MKIITLTTLFPNSLMPQHGIFIKNRARALAKQHELIVVAPVPWVPNTLRIFLSAKKRNVLAIPQEETIDNIRVYHPRYFVFPKMLRSLYGLFYYWSLKRFMFHLKKEFDFDIIDAHWAYPDGYAAVKIGRDLGAAVSVTARGSDINEFIKTPVRRKIIQYTLQNADTVIAVSHDLASKIEGLGVNKEKIRTIPNGTESDIFTPADKVRARKTLDLPLDKTIILNVARFANPKRQDLLINALTYLKDKNDISNLQVLFIGDGAKKDALAAFVSENKLGEQVKFLGEIPQAQLGAYYNASDVFALLSDMEGNPNVLLEALHCGIPVIASEVGGVPEIINDTNGILIPNEVAPLAEALIEFQKKQWSRRDIQSSIPKRSWEDVADDITKAFNDILHQSKDAHLNNRDIVFFSSDEWDSGLKTSKYHIATRLARHNRVFFINSLSLRKPEISKRDFGKIIKKVRNFFRGPIKVRNNLFVYTPLIIPLQHIRVVRWANGIFLYLQIESILISHGCRKPLIWTFLPNSLGTIKRMKREKLIYYCVDDMSAFKGVSQGIIKGLDDALTKEADMVFTVSKELFNKKSQLNPRTFYSPHGVDFVLFNKACTEAALAKPEDLTSISSPIIGFYGLISSDWIDYALINFLAQERPQWSFVFIGKYDDKKGALPQQKNIFYLPVKPYEELYRYSRFFDVAILPFNVNQLTIHSHPLKILEYLSAGKPVVSIRIPEVVQYAEVIEIASSHQEFLDKIELCLQKNNAHLVEQRIAFAQTHSWDERFNEIQKRIADSH